MSKLLTENLEDYLLKQDKNKICILPCPDSQKRKKIHQYLEKKYPSIKKISLKSNLIENNEFYSTFYKCYECDFKRVPINDYHYGFMENNKDEYRTGTCPKCGEHITFEMNYDDWDDITRLYKNNIIVIGDYLKHNNRPNHAESGEVTDEEFKNIIKNTSLYEIEIPDKLINKKKLEVYIDSKLKDIIKN